MRLRLFGLLPLAALLLAWQLAVMAGVYPTLLLPAPASVFSAFGLDWAEILANAAASVSRVVTGVGIAFCVAVPAGMLIGRYRMLDRVTDWSIQIFRSVPPIALIPLAILFFGIGDRPAIILIFLAALWPLLINTIFGVRSIDRTMLKVAQAARASEWLVFRDIILPAAMPSVFTGLRLAIGGGWLTVVTAEMIAVKSGLEPVTSGTITVNGKKLAGPAAETSIVFQDHGLFPWMTVERNVAFNMKARGVPARQRREVAAELIAMTGLTAFRTRYPHELSGGMRQRVGIARALTTRPRALLMDEPFGALDAQTRGNLQEELLRLWQQQRSTVVFVTHSIDEAVFLADRIAVFSARPGRIATMVEVDLPRPRDARSPEFIELSRMLRGQIAPDLHGAPLG